MNEENVYGKMTDSEKQVAEYLDKLDISWKFEYPVFLNDEKERPRLWTPDFYLPDLNIYVEVCGSKNFDYEYRKHRYFENKIDVIYLHLYKDKIEWQDHFKERLMVFVKERLPRLNKMMDLAFKK
ncbi:MAG: hypothetical protein KAJ44_06035 [Thermoplasmatales archaeon]|nr:hypothetical protein [Thermoplasmatales archaeon]